MSPGATMARAYDRLKAKIVGGDFAPGERLDPARLARELATSPTPVREALHRLSGETLIDAAHQEGFRQPHIVEPAIRDLYAWNGEVMQAVLASASTAALGQPPANSSLPKGSGDDVGRMFLYLAHLSANQEHRRVIANLNDRLALYRGAELPAIGGNGAELSEMRTALAGNRWSELSGLIADYHVRRIMSVSLIAANIRRS